MDKQYSLAFVHVLFNWDSAVQLLVKTCLSTTWLKKSLCSDDLTRPPVRDTQHHGSAAFVCQGDTVVHELLELVTGSRSFEFDAIPFRTCQKHLKLFRGCHLGTSALASNSPKS